MNPKERFEKAVKMEFVDRVSCACPLQTGTIALMKKSGAWWPEAHRDAEKMARLAIAANEFCGIESVRVPFCVTVEVEAMGSILGGWDRNSQPYVAKPAIQSPEDVEKLSIPDPYSDGRMPVVLDAVRILSNKVGENLPVIAAISAPFESVVRLRGIREVMIDILKNPDIVKKILNITTEVAIAYGKALIESGADVITLVDGSASTLGPQFYEVFSFPYTRKVAESLDCIKILHICGKTQSILSKMVETGVNGISIDSAVSIAEAKKIAERKVAVVGNVSTTVLATSEPSVVKKEALKCIREKVDILSPACGFPPSTPLENMVALVEAAKESGNR